MSKMREAMQSQPDELSRLLADDGPAEAAAERLADRRVRLIGIGTSWHAAHHGAWFLREADIEAEALHAADVAPYGRAIDPADGVIVLSHTGGTGYSMTMLERARDAGAETVYISGIGNGGDIETVAAEQSYAYTASHTAAMLVVAQIATRLGAQLGPLNAIPERVAAVLDRPDPLIEPPRRLVELIGAGPNGWTAQEGALKIREASYVAARGSLRSSSSTARASPSTSRTRSSCSTAADRWPTARGDRLRDRGHWHGSRPLQAARAATEPIAMRPDPAVALHERMFDT